MVKYNFKEIHPIPSNTDFIDIVLSKTQRKTPTQIHARMQIGRIRQFYMRKVKFCSTTFTERLSKILEQFPKLNNIHPFYSDLINVLYDKDHYKLALGQLNTCRSIIDKIGKDYVKLLKYGDSLYRCKQLKRAAMGRMATIMKKQKAPLGYLEQVRQHLARLPSIDPDERTVMLTGFPNVGKSSFINKITRADVEVQNYAFTTKSLYVGHMDYQYLRWQVIDSPGVLDRPLEDRNTIEMQAITALAHLNACVVFMLDLSPLCEYPIKKQVELFRSLKPLYIKKPVIVVCNKSDLRKVNQLDPEDQEEIASLANEGGNIHIMEMSNVSEDGTMNVRNKACDMLLAHRLHIKSQTNKLNNIAHRIHIAYPVKRDKKERPPCIPEGAGAKAKREGNSSGMEVEFKTERQIVEEMGPSYVEDLRKYWKLENDDWKYDAIPEVWEGKNIVDFVDTDILEKLEILEQEEDELLRQIEEANTENADGDMAVEDELDEGDELIYGEIQYQKRKIKEAHSNKVKKNHAVRPRQIRTTTVDGMQEHLEDLGYEMDSFKDRAKKVGAETRKKLVERFSKTADLHKAIDEKREDKFFAKAYMKRKHFTSRTAKGMRNLEQTASSKSMLQMSLRKLGKLGKAGTSDRFIGCKMPKHLNTGKRGIGSTDWR